MKDNKQGNGNSGVNKDGFKTISLDDDDRDGNI